MSNNYQGSLKHQENARNAFEIAREKLFLKKQKRIEDYNKKPNKCKECNILFTYEQRGKTFCNSSCAASFNNKQRILSKETKEKIAKALKERPKKERPIYHKNCKYCGVGIETTRENKLFCSKICARKNNGCCESARKKISNKVQERLKNGTFIGWKSRKDKTPSYPEQYFINLFSNENIIGWKRDYKVGRWFIDFAFIKQKIALEIDGKQHEEEDRIIKDKIKNEFLEKNNWKVFRIKWYNPINENNKEKLYKQIEEFKTIL